MHRSRNLYICVDSTAKLTKSDNWRVQNEWWNNQLKTLRHKFTYLLPYTQVVFIILGGRDLPDMMKVLLEFIKNDPIAQGDPSKFYHDVLFFLQFNYACHKPSRNSKQIKGWTEELRAEYAKHTPIIKDLHSAAITGMGVTESWSNPKSYNARPSQCKTPNWMEAVLRPAVEILRKTNKPLLNLRKLFMEMEPADDSDKWHYADTMDNRMSWFHAFAMCAHFCYNASHMKHAGDVIWHHQSRLQPHPQYGNFYQPRISPTQIQEPIEPPPYAFQIAAPALENLKQHCYQHLNPQRPPQNPNHASQPQYPLPTPWTPYGERSLIRFHKLQHLQPTDAAAKALPAPQPPSIQTSKPPPPPKSFPQPLPTETTHPTNTEHQYLLPPYPHVTNDKLIGTEIFQLNVDGVKAGHAAEQIRSFRNAQTRDAVLYCGQEVIKETIQMFQRPPYREIHNKPDQTDNPCMIAVNTKYANFIPDSEQILYVPEIKLKHLQCDIEYYGVNGKDNVPLPDIYSAINLHYNATEARLNKGRTKETIKNILRTAKFPKIIFTGDFNAAFRQYRTTEAIERQLYDMGFLSFGIPDRNTNDHYHGEPCLTTILIPIDRDPAQHFPILIKPSVYMERNPSLVLSTPGHPNQGDPHHAQRTFIPGPPTTKSPTLTHRSLITLPGQTTPTQIENETSSTPSNTEIQQQLRNDISQNTTAKPGFTEAEIHDMNEEDRFNTVAWDEMPTYLQLTTVCTLLQLEIPTVGDYLQPTYSSIATTDQISIYTCHDDQRKQLYEYCKEEFPLPNRAIGPILKLIPPKRHYEKTTGIYTCDLFALIPHRNDNDKYEAVPIIMEHKIITRPVPRPQNPPTDTLHQILRQGILTHSVFQKYNFTKEIVQPYQEQFDKANLSDLYDNLVNDAPPPEEQQHPENTDSDNSESDTEQPNTKLIPYTASPQHKDKSAQRLTSNQQSPILPPNSKSSSPTHPSSSAPAAMDIDPPKLEDAEMTDVKQEELDEPACAASAAPAAATDGTDNGEPMPGDWDNPETDNAAVDSPFDQETLDLYANTDGTEGPFQDDRNIFYVLDTADEQPPRWAEQISHWMSATLRFRADLDSWLAMDAEQFKEKFRERYPQRIRGQIHRGNRALYEKDGPLHPESSDANFLAWMRYTCFPKLRWEFTTKDGIPMHVNGKIRRVRAIQGHGPHNVSPAFRNLVKVVNTKIGYHCTKFHKVLEMIRNKTGFLLTNREEGYFSLSDPTIQADDDDEYYRHPRPFTEEEDVVVKFAWVSLCNWVVLDELEKYFHHVREISASKYYEDNLCVW